MAKSLEQKYRFVIRDGIHYFESRYYAQRYIDDVCDKVQGLFYRIEQVGFYFCIVRCDYV